MRRGEIYRVHRPADDPKLYRCFVVVSRQAVLDSRFSTAICAPVFTDGHGVSTQVAVGPNEGLKHDSWIYCDNLVSIRKSELAQYVGSLRANKIDEFDRALGLALGLR